MQTNLDQPWLKGMPKDIQAAHEHSIRHASVVKASKKCCCFYCLRTFAPEKIVEWVDKKKTAICPFCGIDSVIGDKSKVPFTNMFMSRMHYHWFIKSAKKRKFKVCALTPS